jgi:UDPglucose 6-dehydrogenase
MKIAVIGSGYVGLVAAACFAEIGHEVICADNDVTKVAALKAGKLPIHEKHLPDLVSRHSGTGLTFTSSTRDAVRASSVVFIAVGTPSAENGGADLSYVEGVARDIAASINGFKIVVEKSTVPVYTNEWIRKTMLVDGAPEAGFEVVSNPEFLREGTAVSDFLYPDRIVIGCNSERAAMVMRHIYAPILDGSYCNNSGAVLRPDGAQSRAALIQTSARSAELIKHASNAFLAMKISFINAVAGLCESVGADIEDVSRGIGADSRIGSQFLRAGLGYGGSCFPKDVSAFKLVARQSGYEFRLLDEVTRINDDQRHAFLQKIQKVVGGLKGKRFGVLGLAFKGGTDDIRESPAMAVVKALLSEGSMVAAFDPAAMGRAEAELQHKNLTYAETPYVAAHGADALLILTDWPEFSELDMEQMGAGLRHPLIFDGRNLYDRDKMAAHRLNYYSVGRLPAISGSTEATVLHEHANGMPAPNGKTRMNGKNLQPHASIAVAGSGS